MNLPSKQGIQRIIGILMLTTFVAICAKASTPQLGLAEFLIDFAKTVGFVLLGVCGVWLIVKDRN